MTLGWAIIGIGRHADQKVAPAIQRAPHSRLVAVYSRDLGRARAFAERHGAEAGYDSIPDLLRHPGVDVVYIASPNALHKEHTLLSAQAGKHVLVEKPMALTPADCEEMISACERAGVRLGVGFHLRHHPAHREMRRLIQNGVLGQLWLLEGQWSRGTRGEGEPPPRTGLLAWWNQPELVGGGAMMATGVHIIDLMRFLTGQEVEEVTALTDGQTEERPLEWLATALFRFAGGFPFASLVASRRIPDPRNDIVVYGSLGRAWARGTLDVNLDGTLEVQSDLVNTRVAYTAGDMYLEEVEDFNRAVLEGREPSATGRDGLQVCRVTEALFRSAREGRRVRLTPL